MIDCDSIKTIKNVAFMKKTKFNQIAFFLLSILILHVVNTNTSFAQNYTQPLKLNDSEVQNALTLYEKKEYPKAEALLRDLIVKNKNNSDAHYALALVLSSTQKLDDAIDENSKAIELNSNVAEYHFTLARFYIIKIATANIFSKITLSSGIKDELESTLKIDPNHKLAILNLASYYFQAPSIAGGDNDKALELANKLIKIDEKQARILLVQIYTAMSNKVKAEEEVNNLIKIDEYTGRYLLIQGLKKQGDKAKAEEQYKIIDSKFGNNPDYFAFYNDYGYFLLSLNRVDEAVEKFKKQVALAPKSANAHDSLGEGLLKKGMLKESLVEYKKALELDPTLKSAKDKIEEINGQLNN
jgi:Tfp pilus assembly protein PilF